MISVIFENESFAVCVKPVGLSSQSDSSDDMVKRLKEQLDSEIFPVHRLDTDVGGTMVFAKTKAMAAELSAEIQNGEFLKEYLAVVDGVPQDESGIYDDLLFKDSGKNKSFVVKRQRRGVKRATLEYNTLSVCDGKAMVKIRLHTGRTHQIRVQFASRKTPVSGDGKYGSRDNNCKIALWSYSISFLHNGDRHNFTSKPDFNIFPWNLFTEGEI
jgi:23S rRNA pseudouridine1911/1915/1917 synthase